MNIIESLNKAVDYIEEHLDSEIPLEKLGEISGTSKYHFQRIFTAVSGISLQEYIRNRRMSKAGYDIKKNKLKIIDLALKYGYSNPSSFNRAFKNFHHVSPSEARKKDVKLHSYPPLHFNLRITGGNKVEYQIIKKEPFTVYGVSTKLTKDMGENLQTVPSFWSQIKDSEILDQLIHEIGEEPKGILGINSLEDDKVRYYIGVVSDKELENLEKIEIPESRWAIFKGNGTIDQMQEHGKKIFLEWLTSEEFNHRDIPDLEVYKNNDIDNLKYEFWIPII